MTCTGKCYRPSPEADHKTLMGGIAFPHLEERNILISKENGADRNQNEQVMLSAPTSLHLAHALCLITSLHSSPLSIKPSTHTLRLNHVLHSFPYEASCVTQNLYWINVYSCKSVFVRLLIFKPNPVTLRRSRKTFPSPTRLCEVFLFVSSMLLTSSAVAHMTWPEFYSLSWLLKAVCQKTPQNICTDLTHPDLLFFNTYSYPKWCSSYACLMFVFPTRI